MNKELEDKLAENAVELLAFVEKSSSFVVEQAPLYVQELIQFHFFENAVGLAMSSIIILSTCVTVLCVWRFSSKIDADDDRFMTRLGTIGISLVILFFSLMSFKSSAKECFKAKYAPRVLIIEKLRGQ